MFNFFHFFPLAGLFQANKKKRFNQMEKGNSTHMELEKPFQRFFQYNGRVRGSSAALVFLAKSMKS